MYARSAAISALCLILMTVWISGVHVHLAHEHAAGIDRADHEFQPHRPQITETVGEDEPAHFAAHLRHGDIDIDGLVKAVSKPLTLKAPAALALFFVIALLIPVLVPALQNPRPPLRPPAWQRQPSLTPPSHAPPLAA